MHGEGKGLISLMLSLSLAAFAGLRGVLVRTCAPAEKLFLDPAGI